MYGRALLGSKFEQMSVKLKMKWRVNIGESSSAAVSGIGLQGNAAGGEPVMDAPGFGLSCLQSSSTVFLPCADFHSLR